jgi:WD40 repeat protein
VALSRRGSRLATGDGRGVVRVWSATTGEKLLQFTAHADAISRMLFSPDGGLLATVGEGGYFGHDDKGQHTVKIWDSSTGELVRTLGDHRKAVCDIAFGPDARYLASADDDGAVSVQNVKSGQTAHSFRTRGGAASVAFRPDGRWLAAGDGVAFDREGSHITLWDLDTGEAVHTLPTEGIVSRLAFSPDGTRLAAAEGGGRKISLWHAPTGRELLRLRGVDLSEHKSFEKILGQMDGGAKLLRGFEELHELRFTPGGESLLAITGEECQIYSGASER